jgi:hypothetical protein
VVAVARPTPVVAWAAEAAVPILAVAWPAVTRAAAGAVAVQAIEVAEVAVVAAAAWACGLAAAAVAVEAAEAATNGTPSCWIGSTSAIDFRRTLRSSFRISPRPLAALGVLEISQGATRRLAS